LYASSSRIFTTVTFEAGKIMLSPKHSH
jgi:hypothetical protein